MKSLIRNVSRWRQRSVLRLAIIALAAMPTTPVQAEPLFFEAALALALRQAPAFAANVARVESARHAAAPAGELPDPTLVLGLDNMPVEGADQFSLSNDSMTMQRIGVAQAFPNRAKREARAEAARWRVELAEAQARVTQLTVLRDTAVTWIGLRAVEQQLALIDASFNENRLFKSAVAARVAGASADAAETVAPRQEEALLEERRDELRARRAQAIAALRRYIGAAADSPLAGATPDWPIDAAGLANNLHRHPELTAFEPQSGMLAAELTEAQANKKPDWAIELAYQNRAAQFGDMVSLQVSIDLPLFAGSRQNPQIAAKRAEQSVLAAEREVMAREQAWILEAELAEYERIANSAKRQREVVVPMANEKVALALAAWRGTQGGLITLLAARRERIDSELRVIALEGERKQLAARLHFGYGNPAGEQP